jgi:hypothetical protein
MELGRLGATAMENRFAAFNWGTEGPACQRTA